MKTIIIFDFNRTLYDPDTGKLLPGARAVLEKAKQAGFELFLISTAQASRKDVMENLGILSFFKKITLAKEKALSDFTSFVEDQEINREKSFVIGDRVRQEIKFGNQLGLQTIWLKSGKFATELPETELEQPDHTVQSLQEVLAIITR